MSIPFVFWVKPKPIDREQDNFVICYGKVSAETINSFSLAILESGHYNSNEITALKTVNNNLFAYLSLTEVNVNSSLYQQLKPFCYQKAKNWDSYTINIDSKAAQDILISHAQDILAKGFDGLFLDNLDNTNQWGTLAHQKKNMEDLIHRLKQDMGSGKLIQNGGMHLDKQILKLTDYVLIESIATDYDFVNKEYRMRSFKSYQQRKQMVKKMLKECPKELLIVEYADSKIHKHIIHDKIDSLKGRVYITTIDLQKVIKQ